MMTRGDWLVDGAFHAPYSLVAAATILWFSTIYALIAGGAYAFALCRLPDAVDAAGGRTQRMRPGKVREELLLSACSILIFAAQAVGLVWLLRAGWLVIDWNRSTWHLLWELPALYFWNEIHFYAVHRLLHWQP
jgi:lathosterol oxidase